MRFSGEEIRDLLIAWLMISLAFAILFSESSFFTEIFLMSFIISLLTAGIGFLLHELMHKFTAQKYHLWAEFRANYSMLFLAVSFSFFGFIIAAPGAVIIKGPSSKEKNGKIALAGPAANIALAIIFLASSFFIDKTAITSLFFNYGFTINALLALFNLIPFPIFDGYKVYNWNKQIYYIFVSLSALLFLSTFFV